VSAAEKKPSVVKKVSDGDFKNCVLESDVPVLVDFYADWCGPCRVLDPTLNELARETEEARIVKVNIDDSPKLAAKYGVRSIPAFRVFRKGKVTMRHVGSATMAQLKAMLRK